MSDEAAPLRAVLERGNGGKRIYWWSAVGCRWARGDLVPPLLKEIGVALHVEKVRMKPGKPFVLGTLESTTGRKYVAGLPGNPVSAFVTFQRLVREMLRRMEGDAEGPKIVRAHTIDRCRTTGTASSICRAICAWARKG